MPKLKTHSGAKKRFKKLKSGKIKAAKAFHRHNLSKKSKKVKRGQRQGFYLAAADAARTTHLLP